MKKLLFIIILASIFTNTSCEKWLDVQPRTKVKSGVLLKTEQGYKDALVGVYTLLTSESLYARELTFGFVDAVAGEYDTYNNQTYAAVSQWKYTTDERVRSQIDNIWYKMYNVLANINNILDNIDNDKNIFSGDNYNLIKGEALGLRAFIHFDLLRLFGSSDLSKNAIPVIQTLSTEIIKTSTGDEAVKLIIDDLAKSVECLDIDPIIKGNKGKYSEDIFLNDRNMRFNYYAAKATLARVYLWEGDKVNALSNALDVLSASPDIFPWVEVSAISATDEKNKDLTFSSEQIFALNVLNLKTIGNTWIYSALSSNQLYKGSYYYEKMYEKTSVGANDYRLLYTSKFIAGNSYYINNKFYQPDNYIPDYSLRLPLIKRSEMNYIAAECYLGVDNQKAIDLLNEVRVHRGITVNLSGSLSETSISAEILKEYRKEFQGEGQLFYYCKRNKLSKFPDVYQPATESVYVLPLPEKEIEYGFKPGN